ncbi:hypothetical protein CES85_2548 [Ochrobactrum quorumnocens]|uniref:Uncharacterized protein n=1 Tax=Ochrobactrum quorumnocens TaxID=271865 RepID=A0A248UGZ0_9HYPH|nr:hypothetical protein CES85_2548 [[Ochrobactrum] quorumnocens]
MPLATSTAIDGFAKAGDKAPAKARLEIAAVANQIFNDFEIIS